MRVALVCPYAWDRPGGVQSHVRSLAAALRAGGHPTLVVAPAMARRRGPPDAELALVGRAVGVPANGSVAPISFRPGTWRGVRAALRRHRPDIVHLHEPLIPSASFVALAAGPRPSVGTFHAAAPSSALYRFARPALAPFVARLAARTAVSEAAAGLVARYFPGDYDVTPNGIDVARFNRAEPRDLGSGRKVLFLGRIEPRKGLDILVRAMASLRDLDVELVVAGDGAGRERARGLASELGVRARFIGFVAEDDLAATYRGADVFCAPATGGESFGIVLLEAMAAGVVTVCSDLPAFVDVAGGAALTARTGDAQDLGAALRRVFTDDSLAAELRARGLERARAFDWSVLSSSVVAIYERALYERSRR